DNSSTFCARAALSLGFAGFVAVLAAVVIFRPMAAAILRQQSDLIQERDKALRSEQVKRDFLAVMSHELRTPMNGVMGFAKLLSDTDLDEKQRDYVRTIHSSGEGLLEMLNDILDLSKVEAGSLELQRDLVSIDESIHAVVGLMSAKAREKRLALSTFVDPRLPEEVLTDSTCLRKLLLNLVGNAIKFTDAGAVGVEVLREDTVDLSAATGDEQTERVWVRIAVHDTGIGIPKDKLDHIFGRFTQADSSLKRRYDGTGLGLAICQEISELMGGSISVESVEGQGSVFTLRLPLDMPGPEHCAGEPVPEIGEAIGVSLTGVRALVVEPRSVCRRLLTAQLDAYGAETVAVGDAFGAEEARKQAAERDRPFDIVFIDPELPAAPELCKTWRRGEAGRWGARTRRGAGPSPRAAFPVVALVSAIGPRTPVGAGSTDVEAGAFADATLSREATAGTLVQLVKKATRAIPCNTAEPALLDPGAELFAAPDARVSVLVVDDNPTNQKLVAAQLIGQGIEVVGVENGAQALDRLRHRAPSLILMDLRMPVMDGLEATRRIRAMDAPLADLPIIAMTANAMHGDRETCLAAGMDDYLSKPLDLEVLVEKVNHHLSSKADAGTPSCGPEEDTRSQTV
ncbi:MAG: response regulator, partial [Pseudomonadota bacterium]